MKEREMGWKARRDGSVHPKEPYKGRTGGGEKDMNPRLGNDRTWKRGGGNPAPAVGGGQGEFR